MGRKCKRKWPPNAPVKQNKGKEPIRSEDSDAAADDELSSDSSSLPDPLTPKNNVEAESRKRPPRHSSRSVSGMPRRARREFSKERWKMEHAPENIHAWLGGATPPLHSSIQTSERHLSHLCPYLPLSGDLRICCHPHLGSIS